MNRIIKKPVFYGCLAIVFAMAVATLAMYGNYKSHAVERASVYDEVLKKAPTEGNPLSYLGEDFVIDKDFTSHLPIVVLDTNQIDPPITTKQNADGIFVEIVGVDPYVNGKILVFDSDTELNSLRQDPSFVSDMSIKRRGNSSMLYEKAQWLVKLKSESGQKREANIMSMGTHDEWILNGSMMDKSLLRNYLVYWTAAQCMPYTPEYTFCEVLIKQGEHFSYNGVYLIGESISQGVDRINVAPFKETSPVNSYIVRRDRPDSGNMLPTYAKENGLYSEKEDICLIYPGKYTTTQEMIDYVTKDISVFEQAIYSDNPKEFETYSRYIDVDSFVDYFLINEYFGSYDAGNFSTYAYKTLGGKLTMGPVWDFDGALDNFYKEELDYDSIAFQTKPWFDRLCLDKRFINKLQERYLELKRGPLSAEVTIDKMDEMIAHLGGAIDRDWARWAVQYQNKPAPNGLGRFRFLNSYVDEDGDVIERNAFEYEHEILRIKSAIRNHSLYIFPHIQELNQAATFSTSISNYTGLLLLCTLLTFLTPAVIVAYKS